MSCGCASEDVNALLDELIYRETGIIVLDASSKDTADPTTLRGFLLHEGLLVKQLLANAMPAKAALKSELEEIFSADSLSLYGSPEHPYYLERLAEAWRNYSDRTVPSAARLIHAAQKDMGEKTMLAWAGKYDSQTRPVMDAFSTEISFSWEPEKTRWNEKDQYAMDFLAANNAIYMGKHFTERQVTMAKNIIARDQSLFADNPEKAGQRIKEGLISMADASDNYWNVVSTNALNNARSYAGLRYCAKRGIIAYRIVAVMDSKTTPICRALNGRVFPVQQALETFDKMNAASSVEQLDLASPMVRAERVNGKLTGRYIVGKDESRWVFDSLEDLQPWTLDADDDVQPLKTSTEALTASGVMFPPFHFGCRSGIEPVIGQVGAGGQETQSPPSAPPATAEAEARVPEVESETETLPAASASRGSTAPETGGQPEEPIASRTSETRSGKQAVYQRRLAVVRENEQIAAELKEFYSASSALQKQLMEDNLKRSAEKLLAESKAFKDVTGFSEVQRKLEQAFTIRGLSENKIEGFVNNYTGVIREVLGAFWLLGNDFSISRLSMPVGIPGQGGDIDILAEKSDLILSAEVKAGDISNKKLVKQLDYHLSVLSSQEYAKYNQKQIALISEKGFIDKRARHYIDLMEKLRIRPGIEIKVLRSISGLDDVMIDL